MRNRNSDLQIPRSDALLLSNRNSMVSEVYYQFHIYIFIYQLRNRSRSLRSLCGSEHRRASERGIRRPEVRFLMGTQNFLLVSRKTKNIFFDFFTKLKTYHLHYFYNHYAIDIADPCFRNEWV